MIIRRNGDELLCVTQREHARLSGVLYRKFTDGPRPVREAVRHHDDGWERIDQAPLVTDGTLLDYRSIPLSKHLDVLRKSVRKSRQEHPYAGWLVSRHGCSFHENKTGTEVERFLEQQKDLRNTLREAIRDEYMANASRDFDWLQFRDAVSLFVLDPWADQWNWDRNTPGRTTVEPLDESTIQIDSGSLPGDRIELDYRYRTIPSASVRDQSSVRDALAKSNYQTGRLELLVEET